MDINKKVPELLAPVGGWKQLVAAVNNGADAVYMGGILFNARMKADNFSDQDLKEAIRYAHQRNVKIYITQNTLLKDSELSRALRYVNSLYQMGADAIIVQDMGLARLVRKYIPEMTMHLSTQGTVYNPEAVELMVDFGFERIVPARELTLEEITALTKKCHEYNCEVEVFVHGALCICYSGQCQMSRALGGGSRSGNRGLCAQPCRLLYQNEKGKPEYLLSPKDICMIRDLPDLCRAGVDSLKIEGRLKSAEYVAVVTSIYRKYLDRFAEGNAQVDEAGKLIIDREDLEDLEQIFNRGTLAAGYLNGNPGKKLMSGISPKNQGIYIGKVTGIPQAKKGNSKAMQGAAKKGATLVDVTLHKPLQIGDGVELRSGKPEADPVGNVITYLQKLPDGQVRIGDFKGEVKPGYQVYKVTDKSLLTRAAASFSGNTPEAWDKALLRKRPIRMKLIARAGEIPELILEERPPITILGTGPAESAMTKPSNPQRLRDQLSKLGGTPFTVADPASDIQLDLGEDIVIRSSQLNDMRRRLVEQLLQRYGETPKGGRSEEELKDIEIAEALGIDDVQNHIHSELGGDLVPIERYEGKGIPYILNVSKGKLDEYLRENFDQVIDQAGNNGLVLGNPGWMKQFLDAGIRIYGDHGLNVYNAQAAKAFEDLGVTIMEPSLELSESKNIPLMITEHPVGSKYFTDRKGAGYEVVPSSSGDKFLIYKREEKVGGRT